MNDEITLQQLTRDWIAGWRTTPENPFAIEQLEQLYLKDDTFFSFDFGRPASGVEGWEMAKQYYPKFMNLLANWELKGGEDLRVSIRGDIAWTTVSLQGFGVTKDGNKIDMPEARVTLIFEKRDGQWLIVHEHGSTALPFPENVEKLLAQ